AQVDRVAHLAVEPHPLHDLAEGVVEVERLDAVRTPVDAAASGNVSTPDDPVGPFGFVHWRSGRARLGRIRRRAGRRPEWYANQITHRQTRLPRRRHRP